MEIGSNFFMLIHDTFYSTSGNQVLKDEVTFMSAFTDNVAVGACQAGYLLLKWPHCKQGG
jgi:hypothetical protein